MPPVSPYAGDDGSADPALAALLGAFGGGEADLHAVQRALLTARVLVPLVVERADEAFPGTGGPGERPAHMSAITITGRDGRRAQPLFTCVASMVAWNPDARPFPSTAVDVARGAYAAGAVAVIVDIAGPVDVVLSGPAMLALAECRVWLPAVEDPEVLAAVGEALAGLPGLSGVDAAGSADADLRLTLHVPGADRLPTAARDVAQEAARRLAAVDLLRFRLERGLDLAVTAT